jgi:hypothetical protein
LTTAFGRAHSSFGLQIETIFPQIHRAKAFGRFLELERGHDFHALAASANPHERYLPGSLEQRPRLSSTLTPQNDADTAIYHFIQRGHPFA